MLKGAKKAVLSQLRRVGPRRRSPAAPILLPDISKPQPTEPEMERIRAWVDAVMKPVYEDVDDYERDARKADPDFLDSPMTW